MFSQYNEDDLFVTMWPEDFRGRLLEVGAYNPTVFSNSRALIEKGWEATLVEMSPIPLRSIVAEYGNNPKITVIAGAVTANSFVEYAQFNLTDDALSTDSAEVHEVWKEKGGYYGQALFQMIPAKDLIMAPGIDFLSVDTEGSSMAVAKAILQALVDRGYNLPLAIVVEHDNKWDKVHALCNQYGYEVVPHPPSLGTNAILRRRG